MAGIARQWRNTKFQTCSKITYRFWSYQYLYLFRSMPAVKRSVGVAPKVNLRNHCIHVTKHASEGSTLVLKPSADVTKVQNRGYQWPTKRTDVFQNLFWDKNLRRYPPYRSRRSCIQPQYPQPPLRNPRQRCAQRPGPPPPRGRRLGQPGTSNCPCWIKIIGPGYLNQCDVQREKVRSRGRCRREIRVIVAPQTDFCLQKLYLNKKAFQ